MLEKNGLMVINDNLNSFNDELQKENKDLRIRIEKINKLL